MVSIRMESAASRRHHTLRSTHEVPALVRQVEDAMTELGFKEKDVWAVRLALEEALINAIKHGHKYDLNKRASFSYEITGDRVEIEIEDEGSGFDPCGVPDPLARENLEKCSGRGLFLMRAYMTSVDYHGRGNRVTLCKHRS